MIMARLELMTPDTGQAMEVKWTQWKHNGDRTMNYRTTNLCHWRSYRSVKRHNTFVNTFSSLLVISTGLNTRISNVRAPDKTAVNKFIFISNPQIQRKPKHISKRSRIPKGLSITKSCRRSFLLHLYLNISAILL